MAYNLVDDALAEVKARANLPTSNGALTDSELLAIGNAELRGILTGRMLEAMQGYLLAETTTPFMAGQSAYDTPARAVGNKLAYVSVQDGAGNRRSLAAKSAAALANESRASGVSGPPEAFYWLGAQLGVWPAPSDSSESLVFGYYRRPNRMVLSSACAALTSAASVGTTVLSASNASVQIITGSTVDVISASPHFRATTNDATVSVSGTFSITLSSPLTTAAAKGDWVCPAGDSCVIQLPVEVQPLLVARWTLRVMKARAPASPDTQALGQDVTDLEASLFDFLAQRTDAEPETLGPSGLLFGPTQYTFRTY